MNEATELLWDYHSQRGIDMLLHRFLKSHQLNVKITIDLLHSIILAIV